MALGCSAQNGFFAVLLIALTLSTGSAPLAWTYQTGNYLWAVAVSRDGRFAIAGSDDMHAYFFDTTSGQGEPVWHHAAYGYVRDVAISGDGTRAAASDTEGSVFFFDRSDLSGVPVWSFRSGYAIEALAMSEDGERLVAGDQAGIVYFFKTSLAEPLVWQSAIPNGVLTLSLSDPSMVAATAAGGGLYFFEVSSSSEYVWSFEEHTTFPCIATSGDARHVVVGSSDGYVYLVDSSGELRDRERLGAAVSALSISDRARLVVAGDTKGDVSLYRIGDGLEKLNSLETRGPVTSIAISENGERISVVNIDGAISMFDESLTSEMWTFNAGAIVHSLSISADGRIMAAGSDTGSIYLFDEERSSTTNKTQSYSALVLVAVVAILILLGIWWKRRKPVAETGFQHRKAYRSRRESQIRELS